MKPTTAEKIFSVFNIALLCLLAVITLYPMINVWAVSLSSNEFATKGLVTFYPMGISLAAYHYLFDFKIIVSGYANTFFLVAAGTFISLLLSVMTAYSLSRKDLIGRKMFLFLIAFTMMFNGGLIPNFLLVKSLGLINSLWALILPGAISAYNLIIMKNFFQSIPNELIESARIDGLSEMGILFRVVVPLSTAALATIGLFYAVGYWNNFFNAVIYINQKSKWPLQLVLRDILFFANMQAITSEEQLANVPLEPLRMATIMATTLPILFIYPFVQKYFVKGVMIGSIKG